jgi:FkbM family methyltransferase
MIALFHRAYVRFIAQLLWINEAVFFYPALRRFYARQKWPGPAPLVLDIGANRGQSIRFFLSVFPRARVHAFEPNRRLSGRLQQQFGSAQVKVYPLGLSDAEGERIFQQNVLDETSGFETADTQSAYLRTKSRVLLVKPENLVADRYQVAVTTLDGFMAGLGMEPVSILKIDVEGHEAAVLRGARASLQAQRFAFIQLEWHADDLYGGRHAEVLSLLGEAGYTECFRKRHGFGHFYELVFAPGREEV